MGALRTIAESTPLFSWIVGAGLAALGIQAALLRVALARRARQQRLRRLAEAGDWATVAAARVPRRRLEVVALAALLAVPAATVAAVHDARLEVARSRAEPSAASRARLRAAGWNGQLGAISLGIVLEELAGGLGVLAWSLAFAARRQMEGLAHGASIAARDPAEAAAWALFPTPETETVVVGAGSFAALGLLPALQGAASYCSLLGKRLAALADADPAEVLAQVDVVLLEARRALEAGAAASQLGVVLAALTCGGLLWWRSPARARRRWLARGAGAAATEPAARVPAWAAVLAGVLTSIALYLVSRPLQAENDMPWPPLAAAGERAPTTVATPELLGPDRVPPGPVLEVTASGARLDGAPVDARSLRARLAGRRASVPVAARAESLAIACAADAPASRLGPLLAAAEAAGYGDVAFAFVRREAITRPTLGTLTRERVTAAVARVDPGRRSGDLATAALSTDSFASCADLATRIVDLRRHGANVGLVTP